MKVISRKLNLYSKSLGRKMMDNGKHFGSKIHHAFHPHHHHGGQHHMDMDEKKSDLERHHSGHKNHEHRHELKGMGHNIHQHLPLNGHHFLNHGATHHNAWDRKKNH
jgi:hypothetical protein